MGSSLTNSKIRICPRKRKYANFPLFVFQQIGSIWSMWRTSLNSATCVSRRSSCGALIGIHMYASSRVGDAYHTNGSNVTMVVVSVRVKVRSAASMFAISRRWLFRTASSCSISAAAVRASMVKLATSASMSFCNKAISRRRCLISLASFCRTCSSLLDRATCVNVKRSCSTPTVQLFPFQDSARLA